MVRSSMMKYRISRRLNTPSFRGRSALKVVLLDNTEVRIKFEAGKKILGSELFEKVCEQANIQEPYQKYFGLQCVNSDDGKQDWLRQEELVTQPTSSMTGGFQLAVKIFPSNVFEVDQVVQKMIVLQVKDHLLRGKLRISTQEHAILDSYFAQAMLGDFSEKHHLSSYLETLLGSTFFSHPSSLNSFSEVSKHLYEQKVEDHHKSHKGMTASEAFKAYLILSISIFGYGSFIYKGATDMNGKEFILTISFKGIQIFLPNGLGEPEALVDEFPWSTVVSLMNDNSKFHFSVTSTHSQKSKSLQMHSFRFKGHYGYLQANRIQTDAANHRDLVLDSTSLEGRGKRSKSLDEISVRLERLLPGRSLDKNKVLSIRKQLSEGWCSMSNERLTY